MWLYLVVAALVGLGVILGFLGGGIFTIVLIPLAVIVLVVGLMSAASGRGAQKKGGGATEETHTQDKPLPRSPDRPSGRAPTSPEGLADARRAQH
jgi:hypothetical protein